MRYCQLIMSFLSMTALCLHLYGCLGDEPLEADDDTDDSSGDSDGDSDGDADGDSDADGDHPDMDDADNATKVKSDHEGWERPVCRDCHEENADVQLSYECAECHGSNGAGPQCSNGDTCMICHPSSWPMVPEHGEDAAETDEQCVVCHI